jgi:glycosyltransferase involved in cell wall biosynthesis
VKKLAIIGTTGLPAKYGGFETLTNYLTVHLNQKFNISVYCSSKYFAAKGQRKKECNGSRLIYIPLNANGYQSIIYDVLSVFHALFYADVLLLLGVSGAIILPFVKLFSSKPVIVNIDGQEWKRAKWNFIAKKFLHYSEKLAVKYADTVITDNKVIKDYVQVMYKKDSALVEYGGDHAKAKEITPEARVKYPFLCSPYAFTVCRIEPENNVQYILEAYANAPHKTIVVVGLWDHGKFGMELRRYYENHANIILLDPIYNTEELDVLRSNAEVYLHGHSAGGTNPSLVEAMCLGLPVFAYDVSYNRETTKNRALYFKSVQELEHLIDTVKKDELKTCSNNMRDLAAEKYTWSRIAACYYSEITMLINIPAELLAEKIRMQQEKTIKIYLPENKEPEAIG